MGYLAFCYSSASCEAHLASHADTRISRVTELRITMKKQITPQQPDENLTKFQ